VEVFDQKGNPVTTFILSEDEGYPWEYLAEVRRDNPFGSAKVRVLKTIDEEIF